MCLGGVEVMLSMQVVLAGGTLSGVVATALTMCTGNTNNIAVHTILIAIL